MLSRGTSGARVARYAVVAGIVSLFAAGAVLAYSYLGGDRPEEDVARDFLTAFFAGDGSAAYELTTPAYRSLVLREELEALAGEVAAVTGDDVTVTILGSERTPGVRPPESLVGYTADTATGPAEGVVTLFEIDGRWQVADVGYRFTGASGPQLEDLRRLTRDLNDQLEERTRRLGGSPPPTPD